MKKKELIPTLFAILFIGIVWQIISLQIGFPAIFPSLKDLMKQVFALFIGDKFIITVSTTVLRGFIGFVLALLLAILLATAANFSQFWNAFLHPIIVTTRSIPVISFVLLAILWFSPHYLPIFIAVVTMFPILYQNTLTGLENTDKKWIEMAKVFGKSPFHRFTSIYLPASKSILFDGISTAMGFGWRAVIIGEVLAQPIHGIGTSLKQAQSFINVSELIAWTIVAVGVSYFFEEIIKQVRKFHIRFKLLSSKSNPHKKKTNKTIDFKFIKLANVNKQFNNKSILNSFSNVFSDSEVNYLKGPSGIGKTTLLRIISQLEKPDSGVINYPADAQLGYAFQDIRLLPWLTIAENIAYGVHPRRFSQEETRNLTTYLLKELELTEEGLKYPHEISGGQQQRVGLARALAARSDILLLDEPLSGLDNTLKNKVTDFLSKWIALYQPIVIWATHDNVKIKSLKTREIDI